jgi:glycosyltransferase involved in cell wall biosynthesis
MNRVTVAIPAYNGARFLGETLQSLRGQSLADFTLVVLDDASTDGSAALAESLGVRVERNPERLGLAANWNRALALCTTEYLLIAHQDDVYEPSFLATLLETIDAHPRAIAAHCKASTIDEHGYATAHPASLYKDRFWPRDARVVEREPAAELRILRQGNYVIAPSAMLRMELVRQRGPFDARYEFVTDWEYWLRAVAAGDTLAGVNAPLLRFRRHEATATRASERSLLRYEEELQLLGELDTRVPAARPFRPLENNLLADFVARLAAGDRQGAAALLAFARERLPRFAYAGLMSAALHGGRAGGRLLQLAQAAYLRAARNREVRP